MKIHLEKISPNMIFTKIWKLWKRAEKHLLYLRSTILTALTKIHLEKISPNMTFTKNLITVETCWKTVALLAEYNSNNFDEGSSWENQSKHGFYKKSDNCGNVMKTVALLAGHNSNSFDEDSSWENQSEHDFHKESDNCGNVLKNSCFTCGAQF